MNAVYAAVFVIALLAYGTPVLAVLWIKWVRFLVEWAKL